jgi:H+/Cl- antiporter ClcA
VCAITGAVVSHVVMRMMFDVSPIFPTPTADPLAALVLALVVVAPATIASRTVLAARERWAPAARERLPSALRVAAFVALTAATVALVPDVAGNGMDGLRLAADHPTVAIGLALAVAKLVATTGALGAGVPGGAFSPTMATAGGTALLTVLALGGLGIDLPGAAWDAMFPAMVVAVAVGVQAPLTAAVAVPEMAGAYDYVPVAIVVAVLAAALHRRLPGAPEAVVHDEDA